MGLWQSQIGTLFLIELNKDFSCRIQVSSKLLKGSGCCLALRNDDFCFDILFSKNLFLQFLTQPKSWLNHPCCCLGAPDLKRGIWTQVENNHIVIVHPDRRFEIRQIPLPYQGNLSLRKEMSQRQKV